MNNRVFINEIYEAFSEKILHSQVQMDTFK